MTGCNFKQRGKIIFSGECSGFNEQQRTKMEIYQKWKTETRKLNPSKKVEQLR